MNLVRRVQRGLRKPPRVIAQRLWAELRARAERYLAPRRARAWDITWLLTHLGAASLPALWDRLGARGFPAVIAAVDGFSDRTCCGDDAARIFAAAERAMAGEIDLLGSGPVRLGRPVAWNRDFKTGHSWPNAYSRDIAYNNPERSSDVKTAWELSRMQWLIPVGQAYVLSGDVRYAEAVKEYLSEWIAANPYAGSVNWSCTMEAALRIVVFVWFFHVFKDSTPWADESFRARFLTALFLHGDYTDRHIERSDINGNHYTADAAGLVFAGLFFGDGELPRRWLDVGWHTLETEIQTQVYPDGVDFEMSTAYHRLVLELFLAPVMYAGWHGISPSTTYRDRLRAMSGFVDAYSKPDGLAPLWGDADDARVLPFGGQHLNDHRYLAPLVAYATGAETPAPCPPEVAAELFWWLGADAVRQTSSSRSASLDSRVFADGGFVVLRADSPSGVVDSSHVFIDCGPIGLAGRGGHGHNDCLAFEAVLGGARLITDCGAYLYTASYEWRNRFRGNHFHSTPMVDGAEQNRFISEQFLWNMHYDAKPTVRRFVSDRRFDHLEASHEGYMRLPQPVRPVRIWCLDKVKHRLRVEDRFEGVGKHDFRVPYHLDPSLEVGVILGGSLRVSDGDRRYRIEWLDSGLWEAQLEDGWVSERYGVKRANKVLVFRRSGPSAPLAVAFVRDDESAGETQDWLAGRIDAADHTRLSSVQAMVA